MTISRQNLIHSIDILFKFAWKFEKNKIVSQGNFAQNFDKVSEKILSTDMIEAITLEGFQGKKYYI